MFAAHDKAPLCIIGDSEAAPALADTLFFLSRFHLLKRRMAMTMQTMKTTASTGPTTHSRPSSSSTIGWGSTYDEVTGSE